MREHLRVAALLGCFVFSSLAQAYELRASDPIVAPTAKASGLSPDLLGFKYSAFSPTVQEDEESPTSTSLNDDFGEVIRMPKFVAMAHRNIPAEKDMLTSYGRLELAKSKFTTPLYQVTLGPLSQVAAYYFNVLTIFNGWHPNDAEAMTLYNESERVQILKDFDDLSQLEESSDPKTINELKRTRQEVWRTGVDALYWDSSSNSAGILIRTRKR